MKQCNNCHASNPDDAVFCHACGKSLTPPPPVVGTKCPRCGATNPAEAEFCCKCGGKIKAHNFPDEISFMANLFTNAFNAQGGKITITPTQLFFKPHKLNVGSLVTRTFEIKDIAGYEKGMLTFLYIKFKDGKKIKLAVNNKTEIINELEVRRLSLKS